MAAGQGAANIDALTFQYRDANKNLFMARRSTRRPG